MAAGLSPSRAPSTASAYRRAIVAIVASGRLAPRAASEHCAATQGARCRLPCCRRHTSVFAAAPLRAPAGSPGCRRARAAVSHPLR
eukprot:235788-Chlamydomonas_euryale.AAC.1